MTENKRFEYKNHKVFDNLTGEEHSSNMVSVNVLNQLARVNREGVKKVQKLAKENEQLKESNERFSKTVAEQIIMIKEYREENEQLKSDRIRFEEETRLEITRITDKVFELIDKKIEFYKHKPVSAPISNPANPNYDEDVDRLARLSELEDLKETLKELGDG